MAMVILRSAKLKTLGNVAASLSHTYRTRTTPNADAERFNTNTLERSPQAVLKELKEKLPEKRRKDAVLTIEYMVSASPEWFEGKTRQEQDSFFAATKKWLQERHGADNLLDFSIHRDEKSPHAIAYVLPLDEGKLNAKRWLGGRAVLSLMQTDFAFQVGRPHGLERGIEGSRATHTTVKEFYASLNAPVKHVQIPAKAVEARMLKKGFLTNEFEPSEVVAERLTKGVQKYYETGLKQAQEAALLRRRAHELQKTVSAIDRGKKAAEKYVLRLSDEFSDLMELAELNPIRYKQIKSLAKQQLDEEKALKKQRFEVSTNEVKRHQPGGPTNDHEQGLDR